MLLTAITILSLISAVLAAIYGSVWAGFITFVGSFLGWVVLAALFLLVACLVVDKEKPQESDSKFYRWITKIYVQAIVKIARLHIHTEGMEKLPKDGRFVMLCNHIHDIDPAILLHSFPDSQLVFIAKQETKDFFMVGSVLHKLQCQLINRENDREALKTILKCIQIVKENQASIMVFPEGYVSLDGKLRHFRSGVLKIAQKAGVPIVVCTLKGTKEVLPLFTKGKASHVHMHLVDVIPADQVKTTNTVDLAEQVYEMMIADMGEEYRSDEKAMHPDLQKAQMAQTTQVL